MKIVVQKFGGTSVSTQERRKLIVDKVEKALQRGEAPVVVVSAMGRYGEPYATDTLISMIGEKFMNGNKKGMDMLMSCGEILSTVVMCSDLEEMGIEAMPFTGGQAGILTNDKFTRAEIIDVKPQKIIECIEAGKVPIIAGFQGVTLEGDITTIGRGGSDVTAVVMGATLEADRVEFYKDVDGILTSDPNIVPDASLIKKISFEETFQFAYEGAKVIHPRAVEVARKHNLTLVVKNTMNDSEGTTINNDKVSNGDKIITGITSKNGRIQIKVNYTGCESYFSLFTMLGEHDVSLDLINVFPKQKIFTIDESDAEKFEVVMGELALEYEAITNCCKISLIGAGMRGTPGVMARILTALTRKGIEVLQTADSHNTIWCLVQERDSIEAIKGLHEEFDLGR